MQNLIKAPPVSHRHIGRRRRHGALSARADVDVRDLSRQSIRAVAGCLLLEWNLGWNDGRAVKSTAGGIHNTRAAVFEVAAVVLLGVWVGNRVEVLVISQRLGGVNPRSTHSRVRCGGHRWRFGSGRRVLDANVDDGVARQASSGGGDSGVLKCARAKIAVTTETIRLVRHFDLGFGRPGVDGQVVGGIDFLTMPANNGSVGPLAWIVRAGGSVVYVEAVG